jgi:nitrogen fixation/metabolism regulation signal transduction histidine kinase
LLLLGAATRNSAAFDKWLPAILIVNVASVLALLALLIRKLLQLVSEYRRNAPGSRLKARTVAMFAALAVAPLLVVYYFALQFLDRGIDSWFEVEVSQGLRDTHELSRAALDVRVREFMQRTQVAAKELSNLRELEMLRALDRERRASGAVELSVINTQGHFLATSSATPFDALRRNAYAGAPRRAVCDSRYRQGRRIRDSSRRAARCLGKIAFGALADRAVSRARTDRSARRNGAAFL